MKRGENVGDRGGDSIIILFEHDQHGFSYPFHHTELLILSNLNIHCRYSSQIGYNVNSNFFKCQFLGRTRVMD